jgi:hypothetical protein
MKLIPCFRTSILLTLVLSFFSCNNPSSNDGGPCGKPSITSCNGDPCGYFYIYDYQNRLISEGTTQEPQYFYWNETDCQGRKAPCGKYSAEINIMMNGKTISLTKFILVKGENSSYANGRAACNALKDSCKGSYYG